MSAAVDRIVRDLLTQHRDLTQKALDNIIPPWCEGIQKDFWQTEAGQRLSEALWFNNWDEAMPIDRAIILLFGKIQIRERIQIARRIGEKLTVYPLPHRVSGMLRRKMWGRKEYVLYSEVIALKEVRDKKAQDKTAVVAWLNQKPERLTNENGREVYDAYCQDTENPVGLAVFRMTRVHVRDGHHIR